MQKERLGLEQSQSVVTFEPRSRRSGPPPWLPPPRAPLIQLLSRVFHGSHVGFLPGHRAPETASGWWPSPSTPHRTRAMQGCGLGSRWTQQWSGFRCRRWSKSRRPCLLSSHLRLPTGRGLCPSFLKLIQLPLLDYAMMLSLGSFLWPSIRLRVQETELLFPKSVVLSYHLIP